MFLDLKEDIFNLNEEYSNLKLYEVEIRLIEIEKKIVRILNEENLLIKPLVKNFKIYVKETKDDIYQEREKLRVKSLIELKNKITEIIEEHKRSKNYHRNLIRSLKQKNLEGSTRKEKYYNNLKITLLEEGYSEEEIEGFFRRS
jgi:hypothetical protein